MKLSNYPINTCKETPTDAVIASHKLMLRAGLIHKLAAGLYTWTPLGLRVLQKVTNIVRFHMNKAGAFELLMPMVQPALLWQQSQRWQVYGAELLRIKDRHDNEFCLAPTAEEVITDYIRANIKSYKNIPLNLYQIQTKFRDEIRPRFGIMRAREFIMKDAYSFHLDEECLQKTYDKMQQSYCDIFDEIGLKYKVVIADGGNIGGNRSHEFHILAQSGEDQIAFCEKNNYAANIEKATRAKPVKQKIAKKLKIKKIATKGQKTIKDVSDFLKTTENKSVKTLIVKGCEKKNPLIALVLRGDHILNEIKTAALPQIKNPLQMADEKEIFDELKCHIGSLGPVGLSIPMVVDYDAANLDNFICGANEDDFHFINANWSDVNNFTTADIRNVVSGDKTEDGAGELKICSGIEVGHIFQLGNKYSKKLKAEVLNKQGKGQTLIMGCYGIGISRIVAAAIEQSYDEKGIIWPSAIAPFKIAISAINYHKSQNVRDMADKIYKITQENNVECLFDDRAVTAGVSFADIELIGIVHHIIVGDRGLKNNRIEYRNRINDDKEDIKITDIENFLKSLQLK
jgi:prolyl-tRNA synthetase